MNEYCQHECVTCARLKSVEAQRAAAAQARQPAVQQAITSHILGQASGGERTFTRAEVLTVLRAQLAARGPNIALFECVAIFERME